MSSLEELSEEMEYRLLAYADADAPLSVATAHAVAISDVDENTYDKKWNSLSRSLPSE